VSYSDNSNGDTPEPKIEEAVGMMAASSASAPSVPVGQNTYTSEVSVTYAIH
jgi:uncharacterized protein YggE